MPHEEIEDLVEAPVTGKDRFYVRANKPYVESVAALGKGTGGRGSLRPSEEFTYLHQVNPINNKRLLNMKSRTWGTPDGSAFHPVANETSPLLERPTQRAISADGVPDDFTLSETAMPRKGAPPFLRLSGGREAGRKRALFAGETKIFSSAVCRAWRKG